MATKNFNLLNNSHTDLIQFNSPASSPLRGGGAKSLRANLFSSGATGRGSVDRIPYGDDDDEGGSEEDNVSSQRVKDGRRSCSNGEVSSNPSSTSDSSDVDDGGSSRAETATPEFLVSSAFNSNAEMVYESCGTSDSTVGNIPRRGMSSLSNNCRPPGNLNPPSPPVSPISKRLSEEDEGISDIAAPYILSNSDDYSSHNSEDIFAMAKDPIRVGLELSTECGIGAEDYYASLFSRCDPQNTGRVKVSKLLNTLKDFQALVIEDVEDADNSVGSGSSCSEELLELKETIDPANEDPEISLSTFTDGMKTYLNKRQLCCLSPRKCSSMMEDVTDGNATGDGVVCSSWTRKKNRLRSSEVRTSSSLIDVSGASMKDTSLEALAGTVSEVGSFMENGEPDLRAEISDLQLQIQKLQDDNRGLKSRVNVAHDENFSLLQTQRDELDRKDIEIKSLNERIKRLERDVGDKSSTLFSLEDKVTVLQNRNARLENECSNYLKERKELVAESEEHKQEVKKTLRLLTVRDESIQKLKAAHAVQEKQWQKKEKWLNEKNEQLATTADMLSHRVNDLEMEKIDLESRINTFLKGDGPKSNGRESGRHSLQGGAFMYAAGQHSFDMDRDMDGSSDDICTELLVAQNYTTESLEYPAICNKFDIAIQCSPLTVSAGIQCSAQTVSAGTQCQAETNQVAIQTDNKDDGIREGLIENLFSLTFEIREIIQTYEGQLVELKVLPPLSNSSSVEGTADESETCVDGKKDDGMRNGSDSKKRNKSKKNGCNVDGQQDSPNPGTTTEGEVLTESNATAVVRQINEELAEFREQLKKSQELFSVLRFSSCQSISLTKSCPGLALDPNNDSNSKLFLINNSSIVDTGNANNKVVSCSTQTDSPVIETPVLAQKLCLVSSSSSPLGHSTLHHDLAQHHFLSSPGDSMDNAMFDKLSDDGSVRVRDDLSMVLEVSEQENDASPGTTRRSLSFDKGGMNRPKLKRMPNAQEDEDGHHNNHNNQQHRGNGKRGGANTSSGSDKNNHLGPLDDPSMVTSDNDYVSATSSQAESVYLSLERPLKVTLGSSTSGSVRGGDCERGSSNYRSCASSIRSGKCTSNRDIASPGDCDTASLVSEGNTTFGSPLSSPSSPYWTPSQGSSSQETITPLDGERTPVNEHDHIRPVSENCSPVAPYKRFSNMASPSQSEPSTLRNRGMIPDNRMQDMLRIAHDPVIRNTNPEASILHNEEWRQLRKDTDRNDKETYRKTFAQEEGNEDDGAVGGSSVDGGAGSCGRSTYAFALDEEAEQYLETLPDLARRIFKALDVIREKKRSGESAPSQEDRENLDRKFNHMAEVIQTEHTNLDQRICGLTKEFKESEVNLKGVSQSLKTSVSSLKDISNQVSATGAVPIDHLVDVMKSLGTISDEFELYWTAMSRSARRLGMMDVQNRLHKLLDVMILYVHIIRTECDNLKSNYGSLQTDFEQAKKLLEDNDITYTSLSAPGNLQNNNNNDEKRLFDEEELENSQTDRYEDGESEPEKILQHLLGPKKSSAGLIRGKDRPLVEEKKSNGNLAVRWLTESYEVLRRELFWPWNLEQTIKGLKQGFSVMLMIFGLFVFLHGFLPSVSAINESGCSNPSFFRSIGSYFKYCGEMSHDYDNLPAI